MGEALGLLQVWLEKASNPHLRPTKVDVHLPSGKVIRAIRWVNLQEKEEGRYKQQLGIDNLENTQKELEDISLALPEIATPYLVGGSVRDIFLGKKPKDFDVEVFGIEKDKLEENLVKNFGEKVKQVGKHFGVFKVGDIDISLPRKETKIGKKHQDFGLIFNPYLTPKQAALRRDFTINALMFNLKTNEFLDFFGGQQDLQNKIIRHISDETFVEDPLRVYRAAQFASRFGFTIVEDTIELAKTMDLSSLPPERIYEELKKMLLLSEQPSVGLQSLDDMDVLQRYLPELYHLKGAKQRGDYHAEGDVFTHTKMVLDEAAKVIKNLDNEHDKIVIMLGALVHDLGKPHSTQEDEKGRITHHGHEDIGVTEARNLLNKITNEKDIIEDVLFLVKEHSLPTQFYRSQAPKSAFRRAINKYGVHNLNLLSTLVEADILGRAYNLQGKSIKPERNEIDWFKNKLLEVASEEKLSREGRLAPLLTGDDLLIRGVKEGKKLGDILRDVKDKQESGELTTQKEALQYVLKTYKNLLGEQSNVAMGTKGEEETIKKEDNGKIREEFGGNLQKHSLEEGGGNFTEKEEKGPDPASLGFYAWIDNVIEKSGLDIGGNQAYGAKIIGRAIEQKLYQSLQEEIDQYLSELKGDEEEETILEGLRQRVRAWQESNNNAINKAFAELFKRGFAAGMAVAGAKIGTFDQMALEILQKGKYTIGNRIVLFGDELIGAFAKIIKEAYTPKGVFSLESLTKEMAKEVSTERYKLERIARTETSQVSNIGRLWGWENDPDKYYYDYFWNSTPDKRVKEISRVRSKYNPLTFDEAKFLWFNQEQLLPSGKWQMDNYNQRCSLSRSPINEEKKGSRFVGQEESFHRTVDIGF